MTDDAPIDSRATFRAAVVATLANDAADEWWWCDPDFTEWPLDDPALIEAVSRWVARPGRQQLTLLACDFGALQRRHPRFVDWRRYQAHRILGRSVAIDPSQMPTLLLTGAPRGLQLLDRQRFRGERIAAANAWRDARELVDALVQHSEPSFGATVLGL